MIQDVDETIRALIRHDALPGAQAEVVFDAPTKDWSTRRNAPTLDVYLYDIREDLRRREVGSIDVHDNEGRITGRRHPPRHYKLSYLVTAWTQRPEDEHRLLSAVLACFNRHDKLPAEFLAGQLADLGLPVPVTIALPPPEDRALSDVWSALGGEMKPSLDLVITLPLDTMVFEPAAVLVSEQPRISVVAGNGKPERRGGKSRSREGMASGTGEGGAAGTGEGMASGTGEGGAGPGAARSGSGKGVEAHAGDDTEGAENGTAGDGEPSTGRSAATATPIDETSQAGTDAHPGRIFRWRNREGEDG